MNIIVIPTYVIVWADRDETVNVKFSLHGAISLAIHGFLFCNLLNYEQITDEMQESPAVSLAMSLRVYRA